MCGKSRAPERFLFFVHHHQQHNWTTGEGVTSSSRFFFPKMRSSLAEGLYINEEEKDVWKKTRTNSAEKPYISFPPLSKCRIFGTKKLGKNFDIVRGSSEWTKLLSLTSKNICDYKQQEGKPYQNSSIPSPRTTHIFAKWDGGEMLLRAGPWLFPFFCCCCCFAKVVSQHVIWAFC